uniref:Uncharacterized protein n=1 Tax=Oryza rufipogon TaxID=4529 RepID=A0A0E0QBM7_ORYRU
MTTMVYKPVSHASRRDPSSLFRPQNTVTCPVGPAAAAAGAKPARKKSWRRSAPTMTTKLWRVKVSAIDDLLCRKE